MPLQRNHTAKTETEILISCKLERDDIKPEHYTNPTRLTEPEQNEWTMRRRLKRRNFDMNENNKKTSLRNMRPVGS